MQSSTFCRANVEVHEVALLSVEPLYNLKQENCLNEKWFVADAARERHGLLWQGQTDIEQPRADYKGVTLMQDVVAKMDRLAEGAACSQADHGG